jgi:hypothetical protein
MRSATLPSFSVERRGPGVAPSPLRTDVAAFVGRASQGPVGTLERIVGGETALARFGPASAPFHLPRCLRGYFDNGGEIAHVARVTGKGAATARGDLVPPRTEPVTIEASSPGTWANAAEVSVATEQIGGSRRWILRTQIPGEAPRIRRASTSTELHDTMVGDFPVRAPDGLDLLNGDLPEGARLHTWSATLAGGDDGAAPTADDYVTASNRALDEVEVALVTLPDLWPDLELEGGARVLGDLARRADSALDRLIVTELPLGASLSSVEAFKARAILGKAIPEPAARAVALYHPWLVAEGDQPDTTRELPPCGHVAGLASLLDRERGPSRTPATRPLVGVVDVVGSARAEALAALYAEHVNPISCRRGRGLQVLGGRTLACSPGGRYIAHRRLVHRLVRAIRRVAEPLVFEANGPDLWQALRRSATTVLLEAFRRGSLHGATPTQAFSVVCGPTTTGDADVAAGKVTCEIAFAPADPIEWIRILVTTTPGGALEVIEA